MKHHDYRYFKDMSKAVCMPILLIIMTIIVFRCLTLLQDPKNDTIANGLIQVLSLATAGVFTTFALFFSNHKHANNEIKNSTVNQEYDNASIK